MDPEYWHQKWERRELGFHQSEPNPLLVANFKRLDLDQSAQVFVPLCGKSPDMGWLLAQGFRVVGAELSEIAVADFFADMDIRPKITSTGALKLYEHDDILIFVGDIFDLTADMLGTVDGIYDRAALVALPEEVRVRYADHLVKITATAPQLLICFEYDQSVMSGPPFSISDAALRRYYQNPYDLTCLDRVDVKGGLKGKCPASENAWLLAAK